MANQKLLFKRGTKAALEAKLVGDNKPSLSEPIYEIPETTNDTVSAKLKIGDGVNNYADLPYVGASSPSGAATVYQANCEKGADHATVIASVCTNPAAGDIFVVKELIADDKRQYTSYIYNSTAWVAMDGNYSAENVYLTDDITLAGEYTQVGNITKDLKEAKTLSVKGKSVSEVLTEIFSKRLQPSITSYPAVTLNVSDGTEKFEIGSTVSESGTLTASLSAGSYTYGPDTGITASQWNTTINYVGGEQIKTSTTSSTDYSYEISPIASTVQVAFSTTADYPAGAIAKDNLGDNSNPVIQIPASSASKTATRTYSCYRKMFYGSFADKETITSAKIRSGLTGTEAVEKSGNSLAVTVPVEARRVVIAVPSNLTVTSIHDRNGFGAEIIGSASTSEVAVKGANGYDAIAYNVYYIEFANPNDTLNYYDVTIAYVK